MYIYRLTNFPMDNPDDDIISLCHQVCVSTTTFMVLSSTLDGLETLLKMYFA